MKHRGILLFILGCIAIGIAAGFTIQAFRTMDRDVAAGTPPAQRGFVIDAARAPVGEYAASFREMARVRANAVLIVADPAYVPLPQLFAAALEARLLPWLAVSPTADRVSYAAAAEASARLAGANHVPYLVLGLGLDESFGDEAYWGPLLISLRALAPQTRLVFTTDRDSFLFATWFAETDLAAASGDFPVNGKKNPTLRELRNSWASHVYELETCAAKFPGSRLPGMTKGAGKATPAAGHLETAFLDVSFSAALSPNDAPTQLRALLRETKRQPPDAGDKTIPPVTSRPPLAALFLRGWPLPASAPPSAADGEILNLAPFAEIFSSEWADDSAPARDAETEPATGAVVMGTPASTATAAGTDTAAGTTRAWSGRK